MANKYPSDPRLLPNNQGVVCDQCGKRWKPQLGESPNCIPCAAAWYAIENPKPTQGDSSGT